MDLSAVAKELREWSESDQGRREVADLMRQARIGRTELEKARRVDEKDLHDAFTL